MQLVEAARAAAQRLRTLPPDARVRIVAHLDADGISGAAIVAKALLRERRGFHVTYTAEHAASYIEGLDHDPYEANVFVDIGATNLGPIARLTGLQIVLDHHRPSATALPDRVHMVNPHLLGQDGTQEACGATTALAFALALSDQNWDLSAHALVGAFGDRQDRGGLKGWNAQVLTKAIERGLVANRKHAAVGPGPLIDALTRARAPWNRLQLDDPKTFLHDHGIAPEAALLELPAAEAETLTSALVARLLANGLPGYLVKDLFEDVPHSHPHGDLAIPRLVDLVSASAREGEPGLGLALLLGDEGARREVEALESRYHQTLRAYLEDIRKGNVQTLAGLHVFQVAQVAYVGDVCGLAMEHALARTRPALAFAPLGDDIRCSSRGTPELVSRGLDLAAALSKAASAVGGTGGGHPIASGATVPRARFDEFLMRVDDLVSGQLGGKA